MGLTHVPVDTTCAVAWTLVAICIVLTGVRYGLRGYVIRVWYWDDLFHGITLVGFIAQVAAYQSITHLESNDPLVSGQLGLVLTILGYTCVWTTKVAFLMLYRLIFHDKPNYTRAWWAILAIVFITYWTVIAGVLTPCNGGPSHLYDLAACRQPSALRRRRSYFIYMYFIGVATDLAVMILPLTCLHTLRLPQWRKIGVGALFCVGLLIIVFDTLRFAESFVATLLDDSSIFGFVEVAACLIASTIPTLPALRIWKRNGLKSSGSHYGGHLRAPGTHRLRIDKSSGSTQHNSQPGGSITGDVNAKPDESYELRVADRTLV